MRLEKKTKSEQPSSVTPVQVYTVKPGTLNYLSKKISEANDLWEHQIDKHVPTKWSGTVKNIVRAAPLAFTEFCVFPAVAFMTAPVFGTFSYCKLENLSPESKIKLCNAMATVLLLSAAKAAATDDYSILIKSIKVALHLGGSYVLRELAKDIETNVAKEKEA